MNELETKEVEKEVKVVKSHKSNAITKKMYKVAIEDSTGTVTDVSQRLKITHGAVCHYLEKHPEIKELLAKKRLSNIDRAEAEIFNQLEFFDYEKEPATAARIRQNAAQYITSRLGKSKGWVESQQIEHSGKIDNKLQVEIIRIQKKEDEDSEEPIES
jgi:hypothetical protein